LLLLLFPLLGGAARTSDVVAAEGLFRLTPTAARKRSGVSMVEDVVEIFVEERKGFG
jgi:hypothetical protein